MKTNKLFWALTATCVIVFAWAFTAAAQPADRAVSGARPKVKIVAPQGDRPATQPDDAKSGERIITVPMSDGRVIQVELPEGFEMPAMPGMGNGNPMFLHRPPRKMEKAAFLGISARSADPALRKQLGLPRGMGLVADFVEPDSPAKTAGVEEHDVLTKLNDQLLINSHQLQVLVRSFKPDETIKLTVMRAGKATELSVKLVEKEVPVLDELPPEGLGGFRDRLRDGMMPRIEMKRPEGAATQPFRRGHRNQEGPGAADHQRGGRVTVHNLLGDSVANTVIEDNEHSISMSIKDGNKTVRLTDKATGEDIFNGPVNTEEELNAVPENVRGKVERMLKQTVVIQHRSAENESGDRE